MKILQISNSHALEDGGAQRLALELHRAYRERGHDAHLLSIMRSPTSEIGTHSLGFKSPYGGAVLRRLLRFLRQKRFRDADVIHVHLFPAQFWVALAIAILRPRARLVTTEHNTFNRRRASRLGRLLDAVTLRPYSRIICISEGTRESLEKWQPQTREKLVTIANGIDLTRFSAPNPPQNGPNPPIILAVGRITEQKNYAAALRAVALLDAENFEFHIAGQDEMNGTMQALSRELELENRVKFLGFQADIPALLSRADVFLMTSRWEGFGLAVAEAMAAGLPVVVPDVPGVREVVGDLGGAFLIDPTSPQSIAAALARLLQNSNLRRELGAKGRTQAQNFDIHRTIAAHLELYCQLCGAKS